MTRLATLLLLVLATGACGGSSPTGSQNPYLAPSATPTSSASDGATDDVAAFAADLQAAGAAVTDLGAFNPDLLGGRGARLCVAGQQVSIYVYATERERGAASAPIDPNDPSNLGTAMVEWAGNPRFWQRGRIIVLYLGNAPALEAGITSVLGQPFARGHGRAPAPDRNAC